MKLHQLSLEDIVTMRQQKIKSRGGFEGRTFVTIAEHLAGSFGEQYCLQDPVKYPEIIE